ncbi:MAG: hypothetical protein A3F70_02500 [Acidobacteria bacterium RIFCSPLOWO2_12_FULL_67_14]|nr:MAG: hypothetical protein A3H29_08445 [Acidobacteria bacterium RIFCSPLOWO2_02_FULL_67_21]OFW37049.1 MAG: hypothetical protein A3F70_02500 [Acidobacteria bacterium RIFCSPLOWO2_12_FULL_67_14]
MKRTILLGTCATLVAIAGLQMAQAQAKSINEGVFTAEQATRGAALYKEQCAACHGEDMKGNDIMPGLAGDGFMMNWQGRALGELFDKIGMTMPALDPGSLKPEQAADLVAHILNGSKYPAGDTALASTSEALQQIKIDPPKR